MLFQFHEHQPLTCQIALTNSRGVGSDISISADAGYEPRSCLIHINQKDTILNSKNYWFTDKLNGGILEIPKWPARFFCCYLWKVVSQWTTSFEALWQVRDLWTMSQSGHIVHCLQFPTSSSIHNFQFSKEFSQAIDRSDYNLFRESQNCAWR